MEYKYKNLTDKELLQLIKDYYEKNGKTPPANYMRSKNGMPSIRTYYRRFNTTSWIDILKLCDLSPQYEYYSKEEGLKMLKKCIAKLGYIPTQKEYMALNIKPSYRWYVDNFGSMKNALSAIKAITIVTTEEKIQNSIKLYQSIGRKKKGIPTRYEYNEIRDKNKTMCHTTLLKNLNLNSEDFSQRYLKKYAKKKVLSCMKDEDILKDIKLMSSRLKRTPTMKELCRIGYNEPFFQRKCGGYMAFLKKYKLKPYIDHKVKSDDELLKDFLKLYNKTGIIPNTKNLKSKDGVCSYKAYITRFGSIENICKILGIDYHERVNRGSFGTMLYDKEKNLCKSFIEYQISNYFIDNKIEFQKEYEYQNLIPNCKKIFDWKIKVGNETYYLEYFGMYDLKNKNSNPIKRYIKNTRNKIKILYKNNLIDECLFLFPDNYMSKLTAFIDNKLKIDSNKESFKSVIIDNKLTDEDILNKLMEYSDDKNKLPPSRVIEENKLYHYYGEMIKRYGSYEAFGKKFNKATWKRQKSKIKFKHIYEYMVDMIKRYGKIMSPTNFTKQLTKLEKERYKGYHHYIENNGGFIKVKLKALEKMIENQKSIESEIVFLKKLSKKQFPYSGYCDEYTEQAKSILILLNDWKEGEVAI